MNRDGFKQAHEQIILGSIFLTKAVNEAQDRFERASNEGAAFAAEVYRYIQDPAGVGAEALHIAYESFMSQHSGNFGPPFEGTT